MHARCSGVYSTSCEHAARQAASATQQTRRCNCKAPLRLLVVEREPARHAFGRGPAASSQSIVQPETSAKFVFKKVRQADDGHCELDKRMISNRLWFKRFAPIFDALAAANQHNSPRRSALACNRVRSQGRSYSPLQTPDAPILFSPSPRTQGCGERTRLR